jgi:hypothetical protein
LSLGRGYLVRLDLHGVVDLVTHLCAICGKKLEDEKLSLAYGAQRICGRAEWEACSKRSLKKPVGDRR